MPAPKLYRDHAARQAAYRKRQKQTREQEREEKGLPPLPAIATMPGHARWSQTLARASCLLTMVVAEMQAYFDERSETWQEGDRGGDHQQRMEAIQEILDALEAV